MTFALKKKTSSRTIRSPRRRGGAKEALYEQEPDEPQGFVWLSFGGAEGSRTPVRKHIHRNFSERRRSIAFPHPDVGRHTSGISRVMMRGTVNSFRTHGHHSFHAQTRLVVLPGRTAALSSGENYVIVVVL